MPATATSGIYFAKVVRTDTGGASHIVFIVRDDASTSHAPVPDLGHHLAGLQQLRRQQPVHRSPAGRAYKVSYNRPFNTRGVDGGQDWVFNAEYPMVRWLEANGYDVSYFTGVDSDRAGALIRNHKVFLSVGHDEYWSGGQRANVEAARNAGVHLAFFSGNEVFWKTRWENSIDGSNTAYRTLVTLQGDARQREDRPDRRLDRHLARPALQPAGRWRPARERADRHDLHGQRHRPTVSRSSCRPRTARCASGATRASRTLGSRPVGHAAERHAGLRVGLPTSTTASARRVCSVCRRPR